MTNLGIVGIILVVANLIFSYKGFNDKVFYEQYKFEVDKILINKQYFRLFTSGFLHIDWQHLIFNMVGLYMFSASLELQVGGLNFLVIYFAGLLGGDLLALFIHRNHGDYSAVGASGAVCGIMFASIALFPGMQLGLFMIPVFIPAWLFGLLFIGYSIYGIKSANSNIGHEAHLGGALTGMLAGIWIYPDSLIINYIPILIIFIPSVVFIYLIVTRPYILYVDNYYFRSHGQHYTIEHKYNEKKVNRQKEIDHLLDKIGSKGIESLTQKEKQTLEEYSGKNR
jgi:membrane associated rhomboid family serine protease